MSNDDVLAVTELSAGYGKFTVLTSVSLRLPRGGAIAVLGPNGAGKSTFLRALIGQLPPRHGSVAIDGTDVTGWASHRIARGYAALVPEGRRLFVTQTVEDNLRLGAFHLRRDTGRVRALTDLVFSVFPKLTGYRQRPAGALSGGEQQMVAIGRALMADPRVLLLDEPSLGLAPLAVAEVVKGLRQLRAEGRALLVVEQRLDLALDIADRVCVLSRGDIVLQRDAAEVDATRAEELISAYLD